MAHYFMECCFDYEKTRIIKSAILWCVKENIIFKSKKKMIEKNWLVFIVLIESSQGSIGIVLRQKEKHFALNIAMNVTFAVIFKKCFRNCKNHIFSLQEKIWIINQLPGEFFLNSQNIILILDQKQLKQSKVISCVIKQGSMSNAFLS